MMESRARIAVIRFPGVNCEDETKRAVESQGMDCDILMWNGPRERLAEYDGYILPGGFTYQDRVRAGAIAAKDGIVDLLFDEAEAGKPIIGICNGAQILLESGMVPGITPGKVEMGLARNIMPDRDGYYTRWTHLRIESDTSCVTCVMTNHDVTSIPTAHAEGRFVTIDEGLIDRLFENGQVVMTYSGVKGEAEPAFPLNPNGSTRGIAAVSNPSGNVVAMMPHPERAAWLSQVPESLSGRWGAERRGAAGSRRVLTEPGPGGEIFKSLGAFITERLRGRGGEA